MQTLTNKYFSLNWPPLELGQKTMILTLKKLRPQSKASHFLLYSCFTRYLIQKHSFHTSNIYTPLMEYTSQAVHSSLYTPLHYPSSPLFFYASIWWWSFYCFSCYSCSVAFCEELYGQICPYFRYSRRLSLRTSMTFWIRGTSYWQACSCCWPASFYETLFHARYFYASLSPYPCLCLLYWSCRHSQNRWAGSHQGWPSLICLEPDRTHQNQHIHSLLLQHCIFSKSSMRCSLFCCSLSNFELYKASLANQRLPKFTSALYRNCH